MVCKTEQGWLPHIIVLGHAGPFLPCFLDVLLRKKKVFCFFFSHQLKKGGALNPVTFIGPKGPAIFRGGPGPLVRCMRRCFCMCGHFDLDRLNGRSKLKFPKSLRNAKKLTQRRYCTCFEPLLTLFCKHKAKEQTKNRCRVCAPAKC